MDKYKNINVLVIGDVMLDYYVFVRPVRISNEAPILIVKKSAVNYIPGGAGNVASNLASLNAKVSVAGLIGSDYFGSKFKHLMKERSINFDALVIDERPTTVKQRIICQDRQIIRLDTEIEAKAKIEIIEQLMNKIKDVDIIVISDYNKGTITLELMEGLKKLNKPLIVNGKPDNILLYSNVDVLVFNEFELNKSLYKLQHVQVNDASELIKFLNIKSLIVTKGSKGILIYTDNEIKEIKALNVQQIDAVGAGDTVVATLSLEYSLGHNIIDAVKIANKAAAISVTKFGTYSIKMRDIT